MKVAIYTRVSTDDQQSSIENQQTLFDRIIEENNWIHYKTYIDEGISGTKGYKRIDWKKLILDGKNKKYDILLTKSFSRFGRNQSETLVAIKELRAVGIRIIFLEGNLDSERDASKFGLFAWLAEQEAQQTSERLMIIWEKYNKDGLIHVCKPPYGYDYNEKIRNFLINPLEAKWVRQIFSWYIEGYGYNKIAKMLEEKNIPTKKGGRWAGATIQGILLNETYIGTLIQGKSKTIDVTINQRKQINENDWYKHINNHESIIDDETFQKVQELNKLRSQKAKDSYINGGKKHSNASLFSNILVCGECDSPMTIKRKQRLRNYSPFYVCMNYDLNGKKEAGHDSNFIWEEILIYIVIDELSRQKENDYKEIRDFYMQRKIKYSNSAQELKVVNSKIDYWIKMSMTLLQSKIDGNLGEIQFKLQNENIENNLKSLIEIKSQLENLPKPKNNEENILIEKIEKLLSKTYDNWNNTKLKEIFSTIKIYNNKLFDFKYLYLNSK